MVRRWVGKLSLGAGMMVILGEVIRDDCGGACDMGWCGTVVTTSVESTYIQINMKGLPYLRVIVRELALCSRYSLQFWRFLGHLHLLPGGI